MFYQNFNGENLNIDGLRLVLLFVSAYGVVCGLIHIIKTQFKKKKENY